MTVHLGDFLLFAGLPHSEPRRRPAHHPPIESGNRATLVFVTVCTKDRQPLLANDAMHARLVDAWRRADRWLVGRYVILPDHVHLFCSPGVWPPEALRPWIAYWKNEVARQWKAAATAGHDMPVLWQRDFWDTQMRAGESYGAKWEYVRHNPVRHGLVEHAEDWAYQGELTPLRWHDA